jgi:hypothetical protein
MFKYTRFTKLKHLIFLNGWSTTQAEGGGPCFLIVSDFYAKLWKRVIYCDGIATWALVKTIELDNLLSLNPGIWKEISLY